MTYKHDNWRKDNYGHWYYTVDFDTTPYETYSTGKVTVEVNAGSHKRPGYIHTTYAARYMTPSAAHELARALDSAAHIARGDLPPTGEGAGQ